MLTRILHRIVQNPWFYDQVQFLVGTNKIHRRLASHVARLTDAKSVLDLGGGTGLSYNIWPAGGSYICLDIDMGKLQRYRNRQMDGLALGADATEISLRSNSVNAVMCLMVSHHLTNTALEHLLSESIRVLKDGGTFIFIDAIWEPDNLASRMLWKYDRGSFPRTAYDLRFSISKHYRVIHNEQFSIYHEYILCIGRKCCK